MKRIQTIFGGCSRALCLASVFALSACSTDSAKHIAYNTLQNYGQLQCQKVPSADCPKGKSYEEYQQYLKSQKEAQ